MTAKDFTTGIPEIDRLTGSKIKGGSFLLFYGNDDEGMASFLALIEKSGRQAEKEEEKQKNQEKRKKNEKGSRLLRIHPSSWKAGNLFQTIFVIESISESFSESNPDEIVPQILRILNDLKQNQKTDKQGQEADKQDRKFGKQAQTIQDPDSILIGCLYEGVLPVPIENRLKHIADSYFHFDMKERSGDFERTLAVYKYKTDVEDEKAEEPEKLNGKIFRYFLDGGKFQIESKKRIY
ncbi:hypothetical protein [Methanolapillus millepedarum]|uniref:Uncharacterized protein n=1 Tax=Methanolapillus millepedarum TaxID=3028296 RepID=A0AA96VD75_9EURY|nr:hypothetical protein MsAc7_00940 [Methanosarcinaceae archaeon Ac7]